MKTNSRIQPLGFCVYSFPRFCLSERDIYIYIFSLSSSPFLTSFFLHRAFHRLRERRYAFSVSFGKREMRSPCRRSEKFNPWLRRYKFFLVALTIRSRTKPSVDCYIKISKAYRRQRTMTGLLCWNATELYLLVFSRIYGHYGKAQVYYGCIRMIYDLEYGAWSQRVLTTVCFKRDLSN